MSLKKTLSSIVIGLALFATVFTARPAHAFGPEYSIIQVVLELMPPSPSGKVFERGAWFVVNKATGQLISSGAGWYPESVAATYGVASGSTAGGTAGVAAGGSGATAVGGSSLGGATASGSAVAGGGAYSTAAMAGGIFLIALAGAVAIDCYANSGCIWDAVKEAGGLSIVLGLAPLTSAQPNMSYVSVGCNDLPNLTTDCKWAVGGLITGYYSWFWGSFWTCEEIFGKSPDYSSDPSWTAAWNMCQSAVRTCEAQTLYWCSQNN